MTTDPTPEHRARMPAFAEAHARGEIMPAVRASITAIGIDAANVFVLPAAERALQRPTPGAKARYREGR